MQQDEKLQCEKERLFCKNNKMKVKSIEWVTIDY